MGGHNEDTANSMINAIAVIKPPKACFPVIVGKTVIYRYRGIDEVKWEKIQYKISYNKERK